MILLQAGEGENAAIDGANSFVGEEEEMDDLSFWDEHSLDEQRSLLSWSTGAVRRAVSAAGLPQIREQAPCFGPSCLALRLSLLSPYSKS